MMSDNVRKLLQALNDISCEDFGSNGPVVHKLVSDLFLALLDEEASGQKG